MQAKTNFEKSILEISFLNEKAKEDTINDKIYYKSIILLLCAKLEKYVKDSTKEYISELIKLKLKNNKLPLSFIKEIMDNEIEFIRKVTTSKYIGKDINKERSKIFSIIWDSKFVLDKLNDAEFTISISNNGTNEFEDAYKKIGMPDIIKNLSDYQSQDIYSVTVYSIIDTINKVINLRHNIIHDDATPSVTQVDILHYLKICSNFVNQIDCSLIKSINELKE